MESRTDRFIRRALRDGLPAPQRWVWLPFRNALLSGAQFDPDDAARMRKAVWALSALSILFGSGIVGTWNDGPMDFGLVAFVAALGFLALCGGVSLLGRRRRELVASLVPEAGFTYDGAAARSGVFWTALALAAYGVFKAFSE